MKQILFRADDLGYSEAVNYGIEKTVKDGPVRSVGVMVNMPATEHGVKLLRPYDLAFGVHTNICVGQPLSDPEDIPSLVDEKGGFKSSATYRAAADDFVVYEEALVEVEAQYQRFLKLFGRKPDYFEGHAVASANFFRALEEVARRHALKYSGFSFGGEPLRVGGSLVQFNMDSMLSDYDPRQTVARMRAAGDDSIVQLFVGHPGYLDDFILKHSSLLEPRTLEVAVLTDPAFLKDLADPDITLVDYRDL